MECSPCKPSSFPRSAERSYDIVIAHCPGEVVINAFKLSRGQHEVVADGRVHVTEVVGRQRVCISKGIQVRHGRAANHLGKAVVLKHHHNYVVWSRQSVAAARTATAKVRTETTSAAAGKRESRKAEQTKSEKTRRRA